jgi:hypothetical protein
MLTFVRSSFEVASFWYKACTTFRRDLRQNNNPHKAFLETGLNE